MLRSILRSSRNEVKKNKKDDNDNDINNDNDNDSNNNSININNNININNKKRNKGNISKPIKIKRRRRRRTNEKIYHPDDGSDHDDDASEQLNPLVWVLLALIVVYHAALHIQHLAPQQQQQSQQQSQQQKGSPISILATSKASLKSRWKSSQMNAQENMASSSQQPHQPLSLTDASETIDQNDSSPQLSDSSLTSTTTTTTPQQSLMSDWPLPFLDRNDLFSILNQIGATHGIEIGAKRGLLAEATLKRWTNCLEYKLVDNWGRGEGGAVSSSDSVAADEKDNGYGIEEHKENEETGGGDKYGDPINKVKDANLLNAQKRLKQWEDITEFMPMSSTTAAAKQFADHYFDYIYIDGRRHYCGVLEDMQSFWPKLIPGGIMAGHDFIEAKTAIERLGKHEDWSQCPDGTVHQGAVKGAVRAFATSLELQIVETREYIPTWIIQKPYNTNTTVV